MTGNADPGRRMAAYDPRGMVHADQRAVAPRVGKLDGLRIGILDNTKWNANKLLRAIRDLLQSEHALAQVNYYRKESFSRFADPALIAQIRVENDLVLTAVGD